MHLNHLGLPVRDLRRSRQFYSAFFGFDQATAQEYEDGTVIIRNSVGFDLALHPLERVEPSPAFLHGGFTAPGTELVDRWVAGDVVERRTASPQPNRTRPPAGVTVTAASSRSPAGRATD